VLDQAGRPARMLGTGQDISERKQAEAAQVELEKEQRARQRAEEAIRMKDQLLAMVSHELRTPLHAVVGWADVLAADVSNPAQVARGLDVIKRNAQIQARLVDDLLGVSEAGLGQLRLDARPVDLRAVIQSAMEAVEVSAIAKGIRVTAHLAEAASVHGDASRLQQVVWNLLANAIKFTPEGGQVEVALEPADTHVVITVRDSGPGIEPQLIAHIFEPFQQGTAGRRQGGLGLGLSIVRSLVEAHGGRVDAENEDPGSGATFRVRLPRLP
jgi:signal transduction histidine kinase